MKRGKGLGKGEGAVEESLFKALDKKKERREHRKDEQSPGGFKASLHPKVVTKKEEVPVKEKKRKKSRRMSLFTKPDATFYQS